MGTDRDIETVRGRLEAARRITVLTGAGVSAASGVPTFRGAGGLWKNRQAQELATPEAFARDPGLVWEWYAWRREVIAGCEPNAAHHTIARWSRRPGFTLVTQNVDGLHERAGTRGVVRYHGSIWRLRCTATEGSTTHGTREYAQSAAGHHDEWEDLRVPMEPMPPRCPSCGALARPAVVWFGETIPPAAARAAQAATACDVFLSIGTSSVVYPAASLVAAARAHGAFTVEINPDPTGAAVDVAIDAPAETVLPLLA